MFKAPSVSHAGLVVSEHPLASLAGVDVLRSGGTAWDAGIAVSFALSVVAPHLCGLGGDFFGLFYKAQSREILFLNGSGRAPAYCSVDFFQSRRIRQMPTYGSLTVTIPGLVKALGEIHQKMGTRPWSDLVSPAVALAEEGFAVSQKLSLSIQATAERLSRDPGCRSVFFSEKGPLATGDVLRQPALARTLKTVAKEGPDAFYKQPLASRMASFLAAAGAPISDRDFHRQDAVWAEPLAVDYGSYRIFEMPPNSQGIVTLQSVALAQAVGLSILTGVDRLETFVRICQVTAEERGRYLSDPQTLPSPPDTLFSAERIALLSRQMAKGAGGEITTAGDTTFFAVVDGQRNGFAGVLSIFHNFGSGLLDPETGVLFHNRAAHFVLEKRHPNCVGPGKRPRHTLSAVMVTDRQGGLKGMMGTSGGDWRPQIHLWILLHWLDEGRSLQEAIEAPRLLWIEGKELMAEQPLIESRLLERGWIVQGVPYPGQMGVAHGVERVGSAFRGCADIRGDGSALPVPLF